MKHDHDKRSNRHKIKPVCSQELAVLAAQWNFDRRRRWLGNLHLDARNPAGGCVVKLGKTFKGLTDDML